MPIARRANDRLARAIADMIAAGKYGDDTRFGWGLGPNTSPTSTPIGLGSRTGTRGIRFKGDELPIVSKR